MKISIRLTILLFSVFFSAPTFAQIKIKLIRPDLPTHIEFYDDFNKKLTKDSGLIISEFNNYPIWESIKKTHDAKDSVSINNRHGYYKGSGIDYYIEVFQTKELLEGYKNEIYIYADTVVFEFSWQTKQKDIKDGFSKYNLQKVFYCIHNKIKQKDLVIVTFNNVIQDQNTHEEFGLFPYSFLNYLKLEKDISSKYSFNPLFDLNQDNVSSMDINESYNVQMDITVRDEGEQQIKVVIILTRYPETDAPRYNKTDRYQSVLDDFSSNVAQQFIHESKNWLLKD